MKNLVPDSEHGIPMERCQPSVVFARVTAIEEDIRKRQTLKGEEQTWSGQRLITFEFEEEGKKYYVREAFNIGDLIPKLGQWVRGVVVPNQFFSLGFVTTHLMKVEK